MHDDPDFGEFSGGKPKESQDVYCLRLVIEGKVQGVGYRNWLKGVCSDKKLTGWVKNKTNGTVEAMIYGKQYLVKEVASQCYRGPTMAQVKKVKEYPEEVTNTVPNDFKVASAG